MIVSDRRILSTGYNGFPRGVADFEHRLLDKPTKYALTVHAEANAVLYLPREFGTHLLMYSTKAPCSECAKLVVQACINVVYCPPWDDDGGKWAQDAEYARLILSESDTLVDHLDGSGLP